MGYVSRCIPFDLAENPMPKNAREIAKEVSTKHVNHEFDKVELIYHHFKSAGSQILYARLSLLIDLSTESIGLDNGIM